ncbi:LCP family protein [Candidatus Saccharibacteria bacterium]|nr:LCP family protein [Candidatus Saccharibacteria bacterium]
MRKKSHSGGRSKKLASVDGIISDGRRLGEPLRSSSDVQLGDLTDRTDGFHPMRQSPGGLGHTALEPEQPEIAYEEEPVEELASPAKKPKSPRRFWRRRPEKKLTKRQIIKRLALVSLILLLVASGFIGYRLYTTKNHVLAGGGFAPAVCNGDVPLDQLNQEGDGRVNILLTGIGGPGHDGPNLTDTILIASLDPINDRADLISLPRDLWVALPTGGYNKVNAAFAFGREGSKAIKDKDRVKDGWKLLDKTLEPVIGIPIHYHVTANFQAFKDIVDAIGGVTVKVPQDLVDPSVAWENNYNSTIATKGLKKFDGQTALLYAKSRETSPRGDFDRAERQRLLLTAIKTRILSTSTLSNPIKIIKLLDSVDKNVFTDFSTPDIKCLFEQITEVPTKKIKSLDIVTPPHQLLSGGLFNFKTGGYGGCAPGPQCVSIQMPTAGPFNYGRLKAFLRQTLTDGFITRENARLALYNATSQSGLATRQAKALRTNGYKIESVANAAETTNPAATVLVDLSKGGARYTRHYLEKRYQITATEELPVGSGINLPLETDFLLIFGKDVAGTDQ